MAGHWALKKSSPLTSDREFCGFFSSLCPPCLCCCIQSQFIFGCFSSPIGPWQDALLPSAVMPITARPLPVCSLTFPRPVVVLNPLHQPRVDDVHWLG